jgi:hypothetical protein
MTPPPSQRPRRSSLLRRLLFLLLFQHLAASRLQLRTHLHKGLWHPEDEEENPSERLVDLKEPGIEHPEHEGQLCESSPWCQRQTIITQ